MSGIYDSPKTSEFKVWHIPQIPMPAFIVECASLVEAVKIQDLLAAYDLFQYEHRVKPDYSNVSGIVQWSEEEQCYNELDDDEVAELVGA